MLNRNHKVSKGNIRLLLACLLFTMILSVLPAVAYAGQVSLTWNAPTTNADGTPISNFAGAYRIYYGTSTGNYTQTINLTNTNSVVPYLITNLTNNQVYYFVVTAVNTLGNESAYSNEASKTAQPTADTTAPTVSLTAPANGATYTTAQTVTINATAADAVGVTRVEFYDGTTLLGTDTTSPYSYAWAITSARNGAHSLTARAYDAAGNVRTSTALGVTVNIATADTTAPIISLTAPANGATYTTAQTVTINATAADAVGVTRVEFYDGATLLGTDTTSPYSYAWAITSARNGAHSLTARAYDAAGNVRTSTALGVTVNIATADTTAPTVSLTAPTGGTSRSEQAVGSTYTTAQTVAINATAADAVGVTRVEFYDGATLLGTDTTSPYSYAWAITSANNGSHSLTAKAYDAAGNVGTSTPAVSVTVNIATGDTTAPTVSLSAPTNGATYTTAQTVTINATAADAVGVTRVEFYDGATLLGTDTTSPYSYAWAITSARNGAHSLTARAYDAAGNVRTSTALGVTVNIATADTTAPTVSLTAPTGGTTYTTAQTVTINATAANAVGVTRVEFYDGRILLGTDTTSPYSYAWAITSARNGAHSLTARAYDAAGNVRTSTAVSVTINIATGTIGSSSSATVRIASDDTFTVDNSNLVSTITFPVEGGHYNTSLWNGGCGTPSAGDMCGTKSDTGSGIAAVQISIRQVSTGQYWNGSAFAGGTSEWFFNTTGTTGWSSPFAFNNFSVDGDYVIHSEAIDSAGNIEVGPTHTFTIDSTGPEVTLVTPVNGSSTNDATLTYSGVGGLAPGDLDAITVKIYSGSDTSWPLVQTRTTNRNGTTGAYSVDALVLGDGTYTAQAEQADNLGNVSVSSANTFMIDTIAPSAAITFPLASLYNETGWNAGCGTSGVGDMCGTATQTGDAIQRVQFSIFKVGDMYWGGTAFDSDSEVFFTATGTTSWSYGLGFGQLPDGSYTVRVRAWDTLGNVEAGTMRTFIIDGTSPETSITLSPSDPTQSSSATFEFSSDETGATFECRLDSESFSSCTSPKSYSSITLGSHTFEVRATDLAGTVDPTPDSWTWIRN